MDKAISELYEPLIQRVTSIGGDMTTDEATQMLDALMRGVAELVRAQDVDMYADEANGAFMAQDHIADLIDPAKPSRP